LRSSFDLGGFDLAVLLVLGDLVLVDNEALVVVSAALE